MILTGREKLRSHGTWITFCIVLFLGSACWFLYSSSTLPNGASGGSWTGLFFGTMATAFMLVAGLFNLRKKVPMLVWLGSAQFWMKAHIWLGLMSLPMVLFHSAFRFGGTLETLLMSVFFVVFSSGVLGLVLQQYLPRFLRSSVAVEAMPDQHETLYRKFRIEADDQVKKACGAVLKPVTSSLENLRLFHVDLVRPYLTTDGRNELHQSTLADSLFESLAREIDMTDKADQCLNRLREICSEARDIKFQSETHWWLHAWLFIHVPLSFTLLVLGVAHIISALSY